MIHRLAPVAAAIALAATSALAQPCTPTFSTALGNPGIADSGVGALFPTDFFTPGTRQMLIGGGFSSIGAVAGTSGVALWNGTTFSPLGSGINFTGTAEVNAFAVFHNKLYIGGQFGGSVGGPSSRGIVRWNGSAYEVVNTDTTLSPAMALRALTVFQGELYVGGTFTGIGTLSTNAIAKLNATEDDFVSVGGGTSTTGAGIFDMVEFNDGSGDKLYVVGNFTSMGGVTGTRWIARWTGSAWESVGGGIPSASSPANNPRELLVFDDGSGPALYVAAGRSTASGESADSAVHKWDGIRWTAMPGFNSDPLDIAYTANSMGLWNDGHGTSILVEARLSQSGGANARQILFKLENGAFVQVPGVVFDNLVTEIVGFDDGSGAGLRTWLGGFYNTINGQPAHGLATMSGCPSSTNTCPADFNHTGHIEVQDIFDFLAAWFAGCP